MGYGHLIGAYLAPRLGQTKRRRIESRRACHTRRQYGLQRGLNWLLLATLFTGYSHWGAQSSAVVLSLLALATWHTAENDLALADAYANPPFPRLSRRLDDWIASFGLSIAFMALATATLGSDGGGGGALSGEIGRRLPWLLRGATLVVGVTLAFRERTRHTETVGIALIGIAAVLQTPLVDRLDLAWTDVFAWATGYHLISWLVLTVESAERAGRSPWRLLIATHLPPAATVLGLSLLGASAAGLRDAFFAPAPYLFWSAAHTLHTVWRREHRSLEAPG